MLKEFGCVRFERDVVLHEEAGGSEGAGASVIVDMVGTTGAEERIAVEAGPISGARHMRLAKVFDRVVRIPYVLRDGEKLKHLVCGYRWKPRTARPKECPECKGRLGESDFGPGVGE